MVHYNKHEVNKAAQTLYSWWNSHKNNRFFVIHFHNLLHFLFLSDHEFVSNMFQYEICFVSETHICFEKAGGITTATKKTNL